MIKSFAVAVFCALAIFWVTGLEKPVTSINPQKSATSQCGHRATSENHAICTLFPESTEGPYFVDDMAVRQNITEGKPGIPLVLSITVVNFTTCEPLVNVPVDIWSADHMGDYSAFVEEEVPAGMGPEGDGNFHGSHLENTTFLRGVQFTDENGQVTFHTIYPGWYQGRTIHIHVTAHINDFKYTGQLYFPEELNVEIARLDPYIANTNMRLANDQDSIFRMNDGVSTTMNLTTTTMGYETSVLMGVTLSDVTFGHM